MAIDISFCIPNLALFIFSLFWFSFHPLLLFSMQTAFNNGPNFLYLWFKVLINWKLFNIACEKYDIVCLQFFLDILSNFQFPSHISVIHWKMETFVSSLLKSATGML
jgi:hypothetical protein